MYLFTLSTVKKVLRLYDAATCILLTCRLEDPLDTCSVIVLLPGATQVRALIKACIKNKAYVFEVRNKVSE